MRNSLLIITGVIGVLICLAATIVKPLGATNTPTPLALDYPGYFGNRTFIPASNPLPASSSLKRSPGEGRPARSCFQVVEFIVKFAKD